MVKIDMNTYDKIKDATIELFEAENNAPHHINDVVLMLMPKFVDLEVKEVKKCVQKMLRDHWLTLTTDWKLRLP